MCVSVCWCCMWVMMGDVVVGGVCIGVVMVVC